MVQRAKDRHSSFHKISKEDHQFHGEFIHSVQVTQVCLKFRTCDDVGRLYTSNLDDFVEDFYEMLMVFSSYELETNQILQIKESVKAQSFRYTLSSLFCCFFTVFGF